MIYLKLRLDFLPFSCGYCQNAHILKEEVSIMLENPETTCVENAYSMCGLLG
jgi:hypothetical protein